MCPVAQRFCVSDWYLWFAHSRNKTASAPEGNRNHWFPLASRRIEAERRLSLMLCMSFDPTWSPKQASCWAHHLLLLLLLGGVSISLLPSPPKGSQQKLAQVPEEGKIAKINTAPTHLSSVFPHTVGIRKEIFFCHIWKAFFLFYSVKLDIYCQLWDDSVKQHDFFALVL